MNPRQRVQTAMQLGIPDQVPVMCQMATGHILIQSGVDPVAEATDNEAFADCLLHMARLYDFDGILIHKPGRTPDWLEGTTCRTCPEGWEFVYADGSRVRVQHDDDPVFLPADGFHWPDIATLDVDNPLQAFAEPHRRWHLFKGTHPYHRVEEIPESWYGCIDRLKEKTAGTSSLHGETRSPFDHLLNLLSIEGAMFALFDHPDKVHALLAWATRSAIAWSVAQIHRGCDAVKISSPYAGSGFISGRHYREFVAPYERELARAIRAEGGMVYTHTCGAIADRLEDMMATDTAGLECLDPPPLGNVDLADAIERTKGKIFIKGNLDSVNTLLKKDPAGVRADVRAMVATAAPRGGYICSTACSIAPRVQPDRIRAMVDEARRFKY